MKKKFESLKADVLDEIEAIEQILNELISLKNDIASNNINNVQKAAIGTFLMNFYTGLENIIKRISKEYYQTLPKGDSWHKELLELANIPPKGKKSLFNQGIIDRLNPYRGFRHVFVSGYGFKLRLELMISLVNNIEPLWIEIKKSINEFWNKL